MISPIKPSVSRLPGFRTKLIVAMMLVVTGVMALGLLFAQHKVAANVKRNLQLEFQSQLDALHAVREIRYATLAELSGALARKSRIHAALEDNALDLLYPGRLAAFFAWENGTLKTTSLRQTLARQTGMYRTATKIRD